jgi:four helix bundle protein
MVWDHEAGGSSPLTPTMIRCANRGREQEKEEQESRRLTKTKSGETMPFMFEKLQAYQRAVSFADDIAYRAENFPHCYSFLANQLNRAALSIATDLAEGNGRATIADRRNFFIIARGSAHECVLLLEITHRRRLLHDAAHDTLRNELEEIARMISGLISGIDKRQT